VCSVENIKKYDVLIFFYVYKYFVYVFVLRFIGIFTLKSFGGGNCDKKDNEREGMPLVVLSVAFVRDVKCPAGRRKADFFDRAQRGFMLEVRCSGGKTFYQRYTDERGRERQYKIGPADVLTLDQARRKARQILAQAVLGGDPQRTRREVRTVPLFSHFARDRYLPYVRTYKNSWMTDETVLRIHILPKLGRLALDEVTPDAITHLINQMREDGYAAGTMNRVIVIIRYLFNLARRWKVPGVKDNPAAGLSAGPDVMRNRFLTEEEVGRLVYALQQDENRTAAQSIMLLLLTGARRNEITFAKWEYVDWSNKTLLVPKSKSGRARVIALNQSAIALLSAVPRLDGNPYIFPSPVNGKPSASLFFPWDRIRTRAGLGDVRLHDLRHSFASFLVNRGVSLYVVQGLLGHLHAKTTQRYAHLTRETLSSAAELMQDVVNYSGPGPVQAGLGQDGLPTQSASSN
jgi:integrase